MLQPKTSVPHYRRRSGIAGPNTLSTPIKISLFSGFHQCVRGHRIRGMGGAEKGGAVLGVGSLSARKFIIREGECCWSTRTNDASNLWVGAPLGPMEAASWCESV